jgi:hypothetical protein
VLFASIRPLAVHSGACCAIRGGGGSPRGHSRTPEPHTDHTDQPHLRAAHPDDQHLNGAINGQLDRLNDHLRQTDRPLRHVLT